jgi:hypothetical protein
MPKYLDDTGLSHFKAKNDAKYQNKLVSGTNIKTINNREINSNKLIYVQKQNKFAISSQSANGQKKLLKKMG